MGRKVEVEKGYVTTQKTSKKWKFLQLISVLSIIVGLVCVFSNIGDGKEPGAALGLGILAIIGGFILFIIARIGAWWFHG